MTISRIMTPKLLQNYAFVNFALSGVSRNFVLFAVKKITFIKRLEFIICTILIIISFPCFSQQAKESQMISDIAEELAADESDPDAAALFTEYLSELSENPVKINSADEDEISRLFFLTPFQVKALAAYVRTSGKILTVYEIPSIAGFDRHIAEMIMPFIALEETAEADSLNKSVHATLISNFIFSPGKKDTSYLGSGLRNLTRLKVYSGRFSATLTSEKDAGEKFLSGSPPLPDFLSGSLCLSGKKLVKAIILGDYSLRLGTGIGINSSVRQAVRLTQPGIPACNDRLRPYSSTGETNFFRGAAAEFALAGSSLIIFGSLNRSDATLETGADTTMYIKSLYTSGLHNTESLLQKKDNITVTCYGISYSLSTSNFKAGINWTETRFSLPFKKEPGDPESVFDFEGKTNGLLSVNYSAVAGRMIIYGEASLNNSHSCAIVQGLSMRPSDRLSINLLLDSYPAGFTAFGGNGPVSGSGSSPQKGICAGFTFEAAKRFYILGGASLTIYPWLKYRCSFPSSARRHEITARFIPSDMVSMELNYGYRQSVYNQERMAGAPASRTTELRNIKLLFRYNSSDRLFLTTRICLNSFSPGKSHGAMILQEAGFTLKNTPVSIWMRYCLFGTDNWDTRIYVYENDLLYNFSIPALYGEGSRSYIMVKASLGRRLELRAKYGITCWENAAKDSGFRFQLRAWL